MGASNRIPVSPFPKSFCCEENEKPLDLTLPNVYLYSLSVSNFTVSDNHLAGNWDLRLQFRNPISKMSLRYDRVLCTLYYDRETLSETRLQPFMIEADQVQGELQKSSIDPFD
ncbi:hypothetical protein Bca101_018247 [Brassica carinata]